MPPLRRLLLAIFVLGVTGTGAELLLLEHTEDPWQFVPLILLAGSLLLLVVIGLSRSAAGLRFFRYWMVLFVVSGVIGLRLHFQANVEFELEMYPSRGGWELVRESLMGAIPALAPGAMIELGLLGWAFTFRHPLLRGASALPEERGMK